MTIATSGRYVFAVKGDTRIMLTRSPFVHGSWDVAEWRTYVDYVTATVQSAYVHVPVRVENRKSARAAARAAFIALGHDA